MKKSLIICWIANCDYPLFRSWIEKYHTYFDEIIIHWDIMFRFPFYNAFIQQSLSHIPNIKFIDMVERDLGVDDWRDKATNKMLEYANGDWIVSIEQDWFCRDWPELFNLMDKSIKSADMFGWWNPTNKPYIHPAFFGIKRELLDKTSRDFSAHPEVNGMDHFAMITHDADNLGAIIDKYDGEMLADALCFHLGGVNQNYLDFDQRFASNNIHRSEVFRVYNFECLKLNIAQDTRFLNLSQDVEDKLSTSTPGLTNIRDNKWSKFFKL